MSRDTHVAARQLWGPHSTASASHSSRDAWCTPLILPSGGVIVFGPDQTTTLDARVTFKVPCDNPDPIISPDTTGNSSVIGYQGPFYASISPQIFALAAATVISYVLVILIFITPRTFFVGGPGGGAGILGRRGVATGPYGPSSIVGIGRRPLLQKIATVTVAISLTIATADTFAVAKGQYNEGYTDTTLLVDDVVGSLEIRIIRVISDTFLWLAQVQTLIRLFPRHKEKVVIKWLGFAMVSFDTIFSILDSFVSGNPRTRPRSFQDAIPALNYLFELSISLIYASCVVYYSLSKRRFAFWHPKMQNICLVALLSLGSVLVPVVFFVLDISQPDLAGWGEYIRWVGAAAASVVVWEWVERIEALERDERKDGILGREVFDGDEMLNMTPSEDASWHGQDGGNGLESGEKGLTEGVVSHYKRLRSRFPLRKRRKMMPPDGITTGADAISSRGPRLPNASQRGNPDQIIGPPARSDTGSATSTVYAIRYHNLTSPSPNLQDTVPEEAESGPAATAEASAEDHASVVSSRCTEDDEKEVGPDLRRDAGVVEGRPKWQAMPNPFKRRKAEPPAEVVDAQVASGMRRSPIDRNINFRSRLGAFATAQRARFSARGPPPTFPLPVTVIPAPRINERTWSPEDIGADPSPPAPATSIATVDRRAAGMHEEVRTTPPAPRVVFIPAPTRGRTWSPDDLPACDVAENGAATFADLHVQRPPPAVPRPGHFAASDGTVPPTSSLAGASPPVSEGTTRPTTSPASTGLRVMSPAQERHSGSSPRIETVATPSSSPAVAETHEPSAPTAAEIDEPVGVDAGVTADPSSSIASVGTDNGRRRYEGDGPSEEPEDGRNTGGTGPAQA